MLVPRRVRRRLLLPPGWVALGFLLLLGCQALRPWERQLRPMRMMHLTLPNVNRAKAMPWNAMYFLSPSQLDRLRPWHDAAFEGRALPDFLNAANTESATQKIIADTKHAGGVRVRFLPGATYDNLVRVLNIMNDTGKKKYWLDVRHQPVTLYAVTEKSLVAANTGSAASLDCLLCEDVLISTPTPAAYTFRHLLAKFWREIQSLAEHVWRPPLFLLLVISSLSLGRFLPKEHRYLNS